MKASRRHDPRSDSAVRRRSRVDIRLAVGIALVAASVAGVWLLLRNAERTQPVYVAAAGIAAGQAITERDLSVVQVRLGEPAQQYLAPGGSEGPWVAGRYLAAGELVPLSGLGDERARGFSTVVIEPSLRLPGALHTGSRVDIWASAKDAAKPPRVIAEGVEVGAVLEDTSFLSAQGGRSVEVLVPEGIVPVVLAALAAEDSLAVVLRAAL